MVFFSQEQTINRHVGQEFSLQKIYTHSISFLQYREFVHQRVFLMCNFLCEILIEYQVVKW